VYYTKVKFNVPMRGGVDRLYSFVNRSLIRDPPVGCYTDSFMGNILVEKVEAGSKDRLMHHAQEDQRSRDSLAPNSRKSLARRADMVLTTTLILPVRNRAKHEATPSDA
jgi:hypothetical protein